MTKPITFWGTEYASVEAMPPDVRAAYEADQKEFTDALADAGLDAEGNAMTQAPAWGGPRPKGGVPVPVEFDQVTGLGPAVLVSLHDGLTLFPSFGTPRASVMVRYRDGLAYRTGGKEVHTLRWDEIAVIQSNLSRHAGTHGGSWTEHEYTLTRQGGEKLILDDSLKEVGGEAQAIKAAVFRRIGPPLVGRYQAGEAMTFGPVTVQRQNGLQLDGKPYAWAAIQDVRVESGRFKVTLRDGKKHEARVSAIPNIELLCQMIGVNLQWPELPYY
jgi:hypothetical protein